MNINFAIARSNNLYLLHARLGGSIRNFGILNISSIQEWRRLMKIGIVIVSSSSSWRNRKYINSVDPLNWRLIILLVLILYLFLKMDRLVECKYILCYTKCEESIELSHIHFGPRKSKTHQIRNIFHGYIIFCTTQIRDSFCAQPEDFFYGSP